MAGFKGKIAKRYEESKEDWPRRPQAPAGAPNVLVILLDDGGFGQLGSYGGLSKTPNMDKLAADRLRYTDFHTCGLCSPSRAAIMAGRNHHLIGLGSHAAKGMGFPGYSVFVPPQAAPAAKILEHDGFTTYALGTPLWEVMRAARSLAGPAKRALTTTMGSWRRTSTTSLLSCGTIIGPATPRPERRTTTSLWGLLPE